MKDIDERYPLIPSMRRGEEVLWLNPRCGASPSPEMTDEDIEDAASRLKRFASYIKKGVPRDCRLKEL